MQQLEVSATSGLYVEGQRASRRVRYAGRVMPLNGSWEGTMKLLRRQFLHLAGGAVALPVLSRVARAQIRAIRRPCGGRERLEALIEKC